MNLLLIGIALGGVLAFFYGAARFFRFNLDLHDLRVSAHALRVDQLRRIAALRGSTCWDAADLVVDANIEDALKDIVENRSDDDAEDASREQKLAA